MKKAANEGNKNTKRDLEGSKHEVGMLLLDSQGKLQAPQSVPHIQHDAGALWSQKGVNFKFGKGIGGEGERHMSTSQPPLEAIPDVLPSNQ